LTDPDQDGEKPALVDMPSPADLPPPEDLLPPAYLPPPSFEEAVATETRNAEMNNVTPGWGGGGSDVKTSRFLYRAFGRHLIVQ
jgi:hypothetical protein